MGGEEQKKLERRAISLMRSKEIPPSKMKIVRSLLQNESLLNDERYNAIIELIKNAPDKKIPQQTGRDSLSPEGTKKKKISEKNQTGDVNLDVLGPLEDPVYIETIFRKYSSLKLFKKRRLIQKDNRLGLGFKKRLIPTKKLLRILRYLTAQQQSIMLRLPGILSSILEDPEIQDPTEFNLLRIFRRWMLEIPLENQDADAVKWMDRPQFEREFRSYIKYFLSFVQLGADRREKLLAQTESHLRMQSDLIMEVLYEKDGEGTRHNKEKRNYEKERFIFEYISLLRSFLPSSPDEENEVTRKLRAEHGINNLAELLLIVCEALVYQRPFTLEELVVFYRIKPVTVSSETWDSSEELLKKAGKDPGSRKEREMQVLRERLVPFELMHRLLAYEREGSNFLIRSAEDQWKFIDKKHYDPRIMHSENFFNFMDAVLQYFKNTYKSLLDGSRHLFKDSDRFELEGAIFSPSFFLAELSEFNTLLDEMHSFRSKNPTLAVSKEEIKKIATGQMNTMFHAEKFLKSVGTFFYFLGRKIQKVYDLHRLWVSSGRKPRDPDLLRKPLDLDAVENAGENGVPLPFHDCSVHIITGANPLQKELAGLPVLENEIQRCVILDILALCYQASLECFNERFYRDMKERAMILGKIEKNQ